jgi:hypothetical protein
MSTRNVLYENESTIRQAGDTLSAQPSGRLPRKPRKSAAIFRRTSKLSRRRQRQDTCATLSNAYEALSYAWGFQEYTAQILLNERPFKVSLTLELALRRLRHPKQLQKIWVDAICIDQENPEVKEGQIRQMQHIYANASRVVVWLGESSADSDQGLAFAKELSKLDDKEGGLKLANSSYVPSVPAAAKELVSTCNVQSWSALHRLLSRTWWLRAWVVQEVVVAKDVIALCGGISISWRNLSQAIKITYGTTVQYFRLLENTPRLPIHSEHYFISEPRHCQAAFDLILDRERGDGIVDTSAGGSLVWLHSNRQRLCKFPHDKIYSILGLTSTVFQGSILIDYSQAIARLYISVVKASIMETKSLNILFLSQHSISHPELPSWMPDWRFVQCWVIFNWGTLSHSWKTYARFSTDLSELRVKGVVIDAVVKSQLELQILPGLHKTNINPDASGHLADQPDSIYQWFITPEGLDDLFIPALSLWSDKDLITDNGALLNIFLKLLSIKQSPASFDPNWHRKTTLSPNSNSVQLPGMTDFQELQSRLEYLIISGTIIATRNGLAIVPDITQPGDVVCLLSGCDAPVILRRRTDGAFSFIGDAFIRSDQLGYGRVPNELLSKFEYMVLK